MKSVVYAFALFAAGSGFVLALAGGCGAPPVPYGDYYIPTDSPDGIGLRQLAATAGDGPGGAHIMFLNFDGAMISRPSSFRDNAALNQSQIAQGATNFPAFNAMPYAPALTRQAATDEITRTYLDFFRAYNVQVVNTRPASGRYTMCMVGGKPSVVGIGGGAAGVAPLDCNNANEPDVVYAFSEVLTPNSTGSANGSLKAIAVTCAQEVAHAFGLGHTTNNKDIMYPQLTSTVVGFAGLSSLYGDGSGRCSGSGATQQDSAGMLTMMLGAGTGPNPNPTPTPTPMPTPNSGPMVAFVSPDDGSTVPLTFDVSIAAQAPTGKTIDRIEISSGGQTLVTLSAQPYKRTVSAPQSGQYELTATAHDSAGGSSSATVTFAAQQGAPPQQTGCSGNTDCNTGLVCQGGECVFPAPPSGARSDPCPAGSTCQADGTCTGGAGKALCKPSGNPTRGSGGCSTLPIANRSGDGMLGSCLILIAAVLLQNRSLRRRA